MMIKISAFIWVISMHRAIRACATEADIVPAATATASTNRATSAGAVFLFSGPGKARIARTNGCAANTAPSDRTRIRPTRYDAAAAASPPSESLSAANGLADDGDSRGEGAGGFDEVRGRESAALSCRLRSGNMSATRPPKPKQMSGCAGRGRNSK